VAKRQLEAGPELFRNAAGIEAVADQPRLDEHDDFRALLLA